MLAEASCNGTHAMFDAFPVWRSVVFHGSLIWSPAHVFEFPLVGETMTLASDFFDCGGEKQSDRCI